MAGLVLTATNASHRAAATMCVILRASTDLMVRWVLIHNSMYGINTHIHPRLLEM